VTGRDGEPRFAIAPPPPQTMAWEVCCAVLSRTILSRPLLVNCCFLTDTRMAFSVLAHHHHHHRRRRRRRRRPPSTLRSETPKPKIYLHMTKDQRGSRILLRLGCWSLVVGCLLSPLSLDRPHECCASSLHLSEPCVPESGVLSLDGTRAEQGTPPPPS
jgi:hypothetical protein